MCNREGVSECDETIEVVSAVTIHEHLLYFSIHTL